MDWFRTQMSRCAATFGKRRLDAELEEELRLHVELATEEHMALGMSHAQARTAAMKEFGGITQIAEQYRVKRGLPLLEEGMRDIRFGLRQLYRSPGFAATAVLTLALGLGANTAVFSLINSLLLRPLPVPHADELAVLKFDRSDFESSQYYFCAPMFRALEKRKDVFQNLAAFSSATLQVRNGNRNEEVPGALVSGQFFRVLETAPLMGRFLGERDDEMGSPGGYAVVISESFWHSWFNGAPDVVGRPLRIANASFTVVGVMPAKFIGADPTERPNIYVPLSAEPITDAPYNNIADGYQSWWLKILARRKPGISQEQANAALAASTNGILTASMADASWTKDAQAGHIRLGMDAGSRGYNELRTTFQKPMLVVFSLCGAVLLLACLNLASLPDGAGCGTGAGTGDEACDRGYAGKASAATPN